jgi:glycosyltransferase involved in cell wall biosynthesis
MISMPEDRNCIKSPARPVLLWWGRSNLAYSRNAIIRQSFEALGWRILDYRPWISRFGDWQAALPTIAADLTADLVWVPCFRQRDIDAARQFASRTGTPLCIDPLISTYDKQVDERAKFSTQSAAAQRLKRWESGLFSSADRVVADTHDHAQFFVRELAVDPTRIAVIPVSADESMFIPKPQAPITDTLQVLFYGSFLALQGPQVIVQAAQRLQAPNVRITLLGDGPLRVQCVIDAGACTQVCFEPWIDYAHLPARIAQAHLLLGVFGTTPKAGRVIPNKVYQALASARAVITRDSPAYPTDVREDTYAGLQLIDAGRPDVLAAMIDQFATEPEILAHAGVRAQHLYQTYFSNSSVRHALSELLASMDLPAHNAQ